MFDLAALDITAEVIGAVYRGGSSKPPKALPAPAASEGRQTQKAFWSSLMTSLLTPSSSGAQAQLAAPTPTPPPFEDVPLDPEEVITSSIRLTVFTAQANVSLDKKLTDELLRSTKKNPPKTVRYSLIYVSAFSIMGLFSWS